MPDQAEKLNGPKMLMFCFVWVMMVGIAVLAVWCFGG
jgi:hypothetical protein